MKTILLLSCLMLCSCGMVYDDYLATSSPEGNTVHHKRLQSGGTYSTSRSDGSSDVNNMENSQRDGTNMVGAVAVGHFGVQTNSSNNGVTRFRIKRNTTPVPQQIVPEGSVAVPQGFAPQQ